MVETYGFKFPVLYYGSTSSSKGSLGKMITKCQIANVKRLVDSNFEKPLSTLKEPDWSADIRLICSCQDATKYVANAASLIMQVGIGDTIHNHVIFTGDATGESFDLANKMNKNLPKNYIKDNPCRFIAAPHHGSYVTADTDFAALERFGKFMNADCTVASAKPHISSTAQWQHPSIQVMRGICPTPNDHMPKHTTLMYDYTAIKKDIKKQIMRFEEGYFTNEVRSSYPKAISAGGRRRIRMKPELATYYIDVFPDKKGEEWIVNGMLHFFLEGDPKCYSNIGMLDDPTATTLDNKKMAIAKPW